MEGPSEMLEPVVQFIRVMEAGASGMRCPSWSLRTSGIADHVNSNGGTATVLEPEINRPDWELLDSYIQGEISFNELQNSLGCHEN